MDAAAVRAKFVRLAAPVIGESEAIRFSEQLSSLDEIESVPAWLGQLALDGRSGRG